MKKKKETRMQRVMEQVRKMTNWGEVSSEERQVISDLEIDDSEREVKKLAIFIHNTKESKT